MADKQKECNKDPIRAKYMIHTVVHGAQNIYILIVFLRHHKVLWLTVSCKRTIIKMDSYH